jgi:hypothetical protein
VVAIAALAGASGARALSVLLDRLHHGDREQVVAAIWALARRGAGKMHALAVPRYALELEAQRRAHSAANHMN